MEVAPGIHRLGDRSVNWWLVLDDDAGSSSGSSRGRRQATLVDAGLPGQFGQLLQLLTSLDLTIESIAAVVVTHGHLDHLACIPAVRERSPGVEVRIPVGDRALAARKPGLEPKVLVGSAFRPSAIRTALSYARQGMLSARPVVDATDLHDGEVLDLPGRPRFVEAAGHTPGGGILVLESRGVVFSGDVLVTLDPFTGRAGPRTLPAFDNVDHERALASLAAVGETGMGRVLPGHGEPWTSGAARAASAAALAMNAAAG